MEFEAFIQEFVCVNATVDTLQEGPAIFDKFDSYILPYSSRVSFLFHSHLVLQRSTGLH